VLEPKFSNRNDGDDTDSNDTDSDDEERRAFV
jgi:hypothetical protein